MVLDAAAGRVPFYIDTGLNIVHVDDVAEGHVLALEKGRVGERYVLGGENMLLKDILGLVCGCGASPSAVHPVAGSRDLAGGLRDGEDREAHRYRSADDA